LCVQVLLSWSDNECLAVSRTAKAVTRVITTSFTQGKNVDRRT